jgi:peptidoglycan/LPS O-acetylase OafA/YrhL
MAGDLAGPGGEGKTQMRYRADIDGLRAIAVLLVLVFHFGLVGLGDAGFVGVDIFFVISGYLISSIIWRELEEGRFALGHFYVKRIRRLAPALIVVQLATLALAAISLLPSETLSLGKESLFAQLYLSNIYYWRSINYFGGQASSSFLLHTWSLGVEEQYYLVYPLVMLAIYRLSRRAWVPTLLLLCLGSFALNLILVTLKPQATFYLLPTRAWQMMLGALLAQGQSRLAGHAAVRTGAGVAAILLLAVALAIYGPGISVPGWFALLPAGAAGLFLLAGAGEGSPISRMLATPVAVWIGRLSYPLYLVHWPIHIFALTLLPDYGLAWRWAMFALSFLAAWGIYMAVERPIRIGAWLKGDRPMLAAYAASLGLVLAITASIAMTGGWRFRFSPAVLRIADVADSYDPAEQVLDYHGGPIAPFLRPIGAKGVTPHWLIFGDSHAGALAEATSIWLKARGEAGLIAYNSACLPVVDTGDARCRAFTRGILAYLADRRQFGSVLLVSIWRQPIEPGFSDAKGRVVAGSEAVVAFGGALHATLAQLHHIGVRSYVWEPLPAMAAPQPQAMARNLLIGPYWPTSFPESRHDATFLFLNRALDREKPLIAGRINAAATMCAGGTCKGSRNGAPLFEDNNHPSIGQAPYFARLIADGMKQAPRSADRP